LRSLEVELLRSLGVEELKGHETEDRRQKSEAEKITACPINTGKDGRRRIYNFISLWWNYSLSPLFKNMFSMICRFASSVQAFFHVFMAGILFYGPKGRFFVAMSRPV